jgi:alpha-D-ribose 1-methylphosphonate 5-triphosphate synthase subunit PhnG
LAYNEGGRTKTLTLAEAEVADVAAGLARFNKARAELERAADAGIAALRARRGR